MSQHTMVISDRLYQQLTETARGYNLQTVEQLLEMWLQREEALRQRQQAEMRRMKALAEQVASNWSSSYQGTEILETMREA